MDTKTAYGAKPGTPRTTSALAARHPTHPHPWGFRLVAVALSLLLAAASGAVAAHGYHHGGYYGHPSVRIGVAVGPGWWGYPPYAYYPYYYSAPMVVVPGPTTYIERGDVGATDRKPDGYWYYCADAKTYYPYVKECPGGWTRVTPQPPPR